MRAMLAFLDRLMGGERRAAERELERRLDVLRGDLRRARDADDLEAIRRLPLRLAELQLTDDDAALELEMADGLLEVAALKAAIARGEALPTIATNHGVLGGEACHFLAPASRPELAGDGGGKILFTPRRLIYLGASGLTLSWAHVAAVRDEDRDIVVRARPDRVLAFRCNSYADTLRGAWIAQQLASAVRR